MTDKILAAISLIMLFAFLSVVVVFVREIDLAIVIFLGIGLASYDFWTHFKNRSAEPKNSTQRL
tara:strand:- start:554 stop:745 length:192 start_codon:yes stop_codon:yes gene_type:complete